MAIFKHLFSVFASRETKAKRNSLQTMWLFNSCPEFDHDTLRHVKKNINSWNSSTCKALQLPFMNLTDFEINQLGGHPYWPVKKLVSYFLASWIGQLFYANEVRGQ